jgi:molybdate transport system ATP-binding protein
VLHVEARTRLGALELDVALSVAAGECLALAGPSGAGKTSILRVVAGLLRPERGRVTCGDETWLDTGRGVDVAPEARRCGYVFQEHALFGHLRAWQNVAYGLRDVPRSGRRARAVELLARFGMESLADARPRTLSGGERQRVALARALAMRPAVLLLDEPLAALDTRTRAAASRELHAVLADAAVPALLVTHDFGEAALLGDRVGVIDGGRVVQEGTAAELAAAPASAFVADFTGAVVLTGTARADGVYPWEIEILPDSEHHGSAQNRLPVQVLSVTAVGSRVRVGLAAPQPLTAEVSEAAVRELGLEPGVRVVASWKAAATRLLAA